MIHMIRQKMIQGGGCAGHSNIEELRIRVNKNVEKGSDFGHWGSTTFRGRFLSITTFRGRFLTIST